jgi:hypothetical protein
MKNPRRIVNVWRIRHGAHPEN